ncbi:MAG: esterase [Clostridia bacterium]|nr:esterase [Clostridia bacterium]
MQIEYHKEYSNCLGRDMEFKVYGHAGTPCLVIPCQGGKFYEFEDMGMLGIYAPYIESGRIRVFTIDSLDYETYACPAGDPAERIQKHENWMNYIVQEAVPRFREISCSNEKFIVTGLSLGAMHAATLFFRYPDIFGRAMCLSGAYTNEYFFGSFHNDLTYENSPQQFLSNMPLDHPYLEKYRAGKFIMCVGQGAWEIETLESTRAMADILARLNIGARIEFWGKDVRHDWDWWYKQAAYFLPDLLA